MTFASKTLVEHIARGVIGISAFVTAMVVAVDHPFIAVACVAIALVALRGCPTCWTIGLIQALMGRRSSCADGSCALTRDPRSDPSDGT